MITILKTGRKKAWRGQIIWLYNCGARYYPMWLQSWHLPVLARNMDLQLPSHKSGSNFSREKPVLLFWPHPAPAGSHRPRPSHWRRFLGLVPSPAELQEDQIYIRLFFLIYDWPIQAPLTFLHLGFSFSSL